jgi:hypothetical protein
MTMFMTNVMTMFMTCHDKCHDKCYCHDMHDTHSDTNIIFSRFIFIYFLGTVSCALTVKNQIVTMALDMYRA